MADTEIMQAVQSLTTDKVINFVVSGTEKVVIATVIFFIGMWVSRLLVKGVRRILARRHVEKTLAEFLSKVLYYTLMVFVIAALLSELGVQTASLVAVIAGMSVAVGLSLRGSLSNLASGILLVFFKPFYIDNWIKIGSVSGQVKEVGLLYTEILTGDRVMVVIPNSKFMSDVITNLSLHPERRIDFIVPIAYEDDVERAKALLVQLMESDERICKDPLPVVAVKELTDSSVNLLARFVVPRAQREKILFEFTERTNQAFADAGMSINPATEYCIRYSNAEGQ